MFLLYIFKAAPEVGGRGVKTDRQRQTETERHTERDRETDRDLIPSSPA